MTAEGRPSAGHVRAASPIHSQPGGALVDVGRADPLIPEGTYEGVGRDTRIKRIFGTTKLYLKIEVLVPDRDHPDGVRRVVLPRHYGVRARPGGRYSVGSKSDYAREFALVTGRRLTRPDRLEPAVFRNTLLEVVVRTVRRDFRQRRLSPAAYYSVVDYIAGIKVGGGPIR